MGLVSLLFSFNGRIKRSQYWLGTIAVNVVNWMVLFMSTSANFAAAQAKDPAAQLSALASQSALMLPLSLAVTWAALAIQVKRFHDRGQSGWWTLLPLAPVLFVIMNVVTAIGEGWPVERLFSSMGLPLLAFVVICIGFFINLGCLPGTDGPNKYGDPPSPSAPSSDPLKPSRQPAQAFGSAEAAIERAIAEKSRVAPAPMKSARPVVATAPAAGGAPASFGRRPAR